MPPVARRSLRLGLAACAVLSVTAALAPATVAAAEPWWQPAGFAGQSITALSGGAGGVTVRVGSTWMRSADGGRTFAAAPSGPAGPPPPSVTAGDQTWSLSDDGRVFVTSRQAGGTAVDARSPLLGAGAHLIAAPVASPGVVIVVSASGTVWRRSAGGSWDRSLLLLPSTLLTGTPDITALTAFSDHPVSAAVYLGTRGYGVLLSDDGGDDWIRADPGLPADVLSLALDSSVQPPVVWAGTTQGLYVHRLQALPGIPSYSGPDLRGKALLTLAISLLATAAAVAALRTVAGRPSG